MIESVSETVLPAGSRFKKIIVKMTPVRVSEVEFRASIRPYYRHLVQEMLSAGMSVDQIRDKLLGSDPSSVLPILNTKNGEEVLDE